MKSITLVCGAIISCQRYKLVSYYKMSAQLKGNDKKNYVCLLRHWDYLQIFLTIPKLRSNYITLQPG
jgi:hypothetical protein